MMMIIIVQRPMFDKWVKVLKETNKARFLEHFVQFTTGRLQVLPRLMTRTIPLLFDIDEEAAVAIS
jgi:hypothetical protein